MRKHPKIPSTVLPGDTLGISLFLPKALPAKIPPTSVAYVKCTRIIILLGSIKFEVWA